MTFRYWPTEIPRTPLRDGTTVHRPLLPVRVTHAAAAPAYLWALADTGADHTLFPASIAETIGLSLELRRSRNANRVAVEPESDQYLRFQ